MEQYKYGGCESHAMGTPIEVSGARQEIDTLAKTLAELDAALQALDSRLSFVMREPEPTNSTGPRVAQNPTSPLVSNVRLLTDNAASMTHRLSEIMRRLDV